MAHSKRPGLVNDPQGGLSTVRVMSFIALGMAAWLTARSAITGQPVQIDVLVVWIVAAFAPKVVQRFAERETLTKRGGINEPGQSASSGDDGEGDNQGTPPRTGGNGGLP